MSIIIEGRMIVKNGSENCKFTVEEANELIKEGYEGMLSFFGGYEIEGIKYFASGLSVGNETYIFEKDGKLVIPTFFRKDLLATHNDGDQNELVKVEVVINPQEAEFLQLTLGKREVI